MSTITRNIIKIDSGRCSGCGICTLDCVEGAIRLEGGKAVLADEHLCGGLGLCLKCCPTGALSVERRAARPYDEEEVRRRCLLELTGSAEREGFDAAGGTSTDLAPPRPVAGVGREAPFAWPVKLSLLSSLPQGADILLCADCAPPLIDDFYRKYFSRYRVVMVCPRLEDTGELAIKLAEFYRVSPPGSITTLRMMTECCRGTALLSRGAINISGVKAKSRDILLRPDGALIE